VGVFAYRNWGFGLVQEDGGKLRNGRHRAAPSALALQLAMSGGAGEMQPEVTPLDDE